MKSIEWTLQASEYSSIEELPIEDQDLMQEAIVARTNAYAPYSHFQVGAAILLEDGTVVTGSNQENAAYPSGMCAERVAVWKAGASYPDQKILKLAISASSSKKEVNKPVGPCGACRQSLAEYEQKQQSPFPILFMGENGPVIKVKSLQDLLPFSFDADFL